MEITDYKFESFKITFYEKDTTDYALIVKPPYEEYHPYQSYVKLTLVYSDKTEKHIKFYDYGENAEIKDTELIISTQKLFIANWTHWGIINLETFKIEKLEYSEFGVGLEKVKNTIVVDNELVVYAYDISGNLIDEQPIDPPTERQYFDNYIEFNSIVFGKRILKII